MVQGAELWEKNPAIKKEITDQKERKSTISKPEQVEKGAGKKRKGSQGRVGTMAGMYRHIPSLERARMNEMEKGRHRE